MTLLIDEKIVKKLYWIEKLYLQFGYFMKIKCLIDTKFSWHLTIMFNYNFKIKFKYPKNKSQNLENIERDYKF